jgi:hypothetical protein
MIDAIAEQTIGLCERCGAHGPLHAQPAGGGRNSKVTHLSNRDGQWILKEYYPQGAQGGDRLGTEFAFLQYLQEAGVARVARPLGMDRVSHRALYTCLPGERPARITADYVTQAAHFIGAINRKRTTPQALALAGAADACVNWHDHLALARTRLAQLTETQPQSAVAEQAHALVVERFMPQWLALEKTLSENVLADRAITQILSPSDFGFHNTLVDQGRLSFVDFEYAGWDDPTKLACDFICQPEMPITATQGIQFIEQLVTVLPHLDAICKRVELLLPVHRLKWCCILLNEFRPEHHRRRLHAGIASDGLLSTQLDKARRYFDSHFGFN